MASVAGPLFVTPESARGAEEAASATDMIQYISCPFNKVGESQAREVTGDFSDMDTDAPPQGIHWTGTLVTEVKASTDGSANPEIHPLLEAGGFTESSNVYTLNPQLNLPAALKSVTMRKEYEPQGEGNVRIAIGVLFGGFTLDHSMDNPTRMSWPWMGQYKTPADLAAVTAGTPNTGVPLNLLTTASIHSYAALVRSFQLNVLRTQTARRSAAAASTYRHVWPCAMGVQQVTWNAVIEEVDQTAFAVYAAFEAATNGTVSLVWTAGSRTLTVALTGSVIKSITEQEGIPNAYNLQGTCGGEGCVTLTFA